MHSSHHIDHWTAEYQSLPRIFDGIDYPEMFRKAASYVDRILRGAKPNELPVQLPTKFELVINIKTAKSIGLTFPQTIIASADDVIE